MSVNAMPRIVIPDDAPPVMAESQAYRKLLERTPVDYHDTLPATEERLIERLAAAEIVINIRSSTRFTENVFSHRPALKCENARPMAGDPRRCSCIACIPCLAEVSAVAGCE